MSSGASARSAETLERRSLSPLPREGFAPLDLAALDWVEKAHTQGSGRDTASDQQTTLCSFSKSINQ